MKKLLAYILTLIGALFIRAALGLDPENVKKVIRESIKEALEELEEESPDDFYGWSQQVWEKGDPDFDLYPKD